MGAHFTQTYWHYSDRHTMPPFAIKTVIETDTRAGYSCDILCVLYHEGLQTVTQRHFAHQWKNERLDAFAHRFWRGAREKGADVSDFEFDRYMMHLLDALTSDTRKEYIYD